MEEDGPCASVCYSQLCQLQGQQNPVKDLRPSWYPREDLLEFCPQQFHRQDGRRRLSPSPDRRAGWKLTAGHLHVLLHDHKQGRRKGRDE